MNSTTERRWLRIEVLGGGTDNDLYYLLRWCSSRAARQVSPYLSRGRTPPPPLPPTPRPSRRRSNRPRWRAMGAATVVRYRPQTAGQHTGRKNEPSSYAYPVFLFGHRDVAGSLRCRCHRRPLPPPARRCLPRPLQPPAGPPPGVVSCTGGGSPSGGGISHQGSDRRRATTETRPGALPSPSLASASPPRRPDRGAPHLLKEGAVCWVQPLDRGRRLLRNPPTFRFV
jgi:hypothetical protein